MMIQCHFKSISLPKLGNSVDENEDNVLEPSKSDLKSDILHFAISDGATESSFSKEWSELLVRAYKDKPFDKICLPETIKTVSEMWQLMINTTNLPWFAEQKAENGAFATFLGLTINRGQSFFEIIAIGDCNLFHIREHRIDFSFPISTIEGFHNTPNLIASNDKYQTDFKRNAIYEKRSIQSNDVIILATDAIAEWILKQKNRPEKIRKTLIEKFEKQDESTFEKWLNKKRMTNRIKNDDVTLVMIKFE